ncbi:hypothetical protein KIN20_013330 [Parelaphostrongylus tenuis]|uniref:Uncharacterized protein n=1 Tax=Parelaphostrongylus tenuis TaxID=148309 RepID=A0AAD5MX96_PARTN|nr:hypothetical protein KIN20_013330 [Parelaphostrongylus tenuis]
MEGALSSALSTKVGVAASRPSTFYDRLYDLFSTRTASSVMAVFLLIAIIGTVALLRYLDEYGNDTRTTSSESHRRDSSSPPSSPPLTDGADARPVTTASFASPLYQPSPAQPRASPSTADSSPEQASRRLAEFMIDFDRSRYV